MERTRQRRVAGPLAAILLVTAACSGGDEGSVATETDPAGVGGDASTTVADEPAPADTDEPAPEPPASAVGRFAGVTLAVDAAEQLNRVDLVGLDVDAAGVRDLIATYEIADGDWWGSRILLDDGGPYLLAPLYAPDPVAGGQVELHLSDGADEGPPLALRLDPMAQAPGAFEAALDEMEVAFGSLAAEYGSSWDELVALAPGDTPPELAPLKLAELLIGDDAGARGAYAALEPADAALVDAIFAKVDVAAGLDDESFDTLAAFLPEQVGGGTPQGFASPHRATRAAAGQAGAAPRQGGAGCIPFYAEGGGQLSAQRLSEMMIGSAMSDIAVNPDGTPGQTFAALEATLTLGSVLEAGASGGKSEVFGAVGKATGGWKLFNQMRAGLLPSSFTRITVELDPGDLEEDRPVAKPGRWPKVTVWAMSTGYTLDGDIAGELAGMFGGKLMETRLPKGTDAPEDAVDWFHKLGDDVDVTDINNAGGADPIKGAVNDLLPEGGVINLCPQEFTADIGDGDWTWARPLQGLLTVDNDARTYVNTTDIGVDTLAIGPLPNKFGQRSIYERLPVETHAIDVRIEPDVIYVTQPGKPASIPASIRWADETKLGWAADKGTWASTGTGYVETDGGGTEVLNTPDRAEDFGEDGIRVEVESLSRQNLREDGDPPRYDFVLVKLAPFTIEPDPGQTTVGEQLTFAAFDAEGDPIEVRWSATGGQITGGPSATAVYTAGDRAGSYTVTGTLNGVEVTVVVNVGDQACIIGNWELDVPKFVEAMNRFADGGGVTYLSGDSQIIIREDDTTTWDMNDVRLRMTQDGQTFTLVWNSSVDNTYSADGGNFSGTGGTATFNMFVEELGRGIDMTVPSALGGAATYDCEPRERLTVYTEDGTLHLTYNGPA